jgi:hypothetical protein
MSDPYHPDSFGWIPIRKVSKDELRKMFGEEQPMSDEKKIWEEDWRVVKNYATQDDEIIDADGTPLFVSVTTAVRDRLAAQAPRMARLLLKVMQAEWDHDDVEAVLSDAGVIE